MILENEVKFEVMNSRRFEVKEISLFSHCYG